MKNFFILVWSVLFISCAGSPLYPVRKNGTGANYGQQQRPATAPAQRLQMPIVITQSAPTSNQSVAPTPTTASTPIVAAQPSIPDVELPTEKNDLLTIIKTPAVAKNKILEAIEAETELANINKALEEPATETQVQLFKPNLYFKAGQLAQKKRKPDLALQYYRALIAGHPQSSLAAKANSEINLISASEEVDAKVIGAILPLTGKNANIGQHALNAIRIGMGLNKPNAKLRLAIFDTQGSVELAAAAVEKLVRDDKVIALIGGLSSKEALAVGQKADLLGVPFIGLSQKSGLTGIGDFIFRNSLTAEMQIDRLVEFATEKLKAKRFAVLYPNDAYGVEFANIYWDHVLARGATITAAQTYDPKENDFTTVIQKMVGTYFPEARPEEYKERVKELAKERKEKAEKNKGKKPVVKNSRVHENQESVLLPVVDFDVLFIPDTGKALSQVMAFMKATEVPPLTFLGTNIWNSPDLVKRTGSNNNNLIYFVDALDLSDNTARDSQFYKDYFSEYNEEPSLIEMQVFESAKILRDLLASGATSREQLASNLRSLGRTAGVTGELRMSSQRELERPLHILSLETGLVKKVD